MFWELWEDPLPKDNENIISDRYKTMPSIGYDSLARNLTRGKTRIYKYMEVQCDEKNLLEYLERS